MKTREEIIAANPLPEVMRDFGVELRKQGGYFMAKCPFHEDGKASLSVDPVKNVFKCHGCGQAGSVIDFVARKKGLSIRDAFRELGGGGDTEPANRGNGSHNGHPPAAAKPQGNIVCTYDYLSETGALLYQVCRMEPKDFRQRRPDDTGSWVWNMNGVRRVLYNLPKIMRVGLPQAWICEGEKDCDALGAYGITATTNVGGAGKWMDGYAEALKGKEIVLCPDNDEPGRKHMAQVLESLAGKVESVRQVRVPEPHKDISDYLATLPDKSAAVEAIGKLYDDAPMFTRGVDLPVQSMVEMEIEFTRHIRRAHTHSLDLGQWIPSLGRYCRPLVPGELVVILGDTGVGKTALLQSLAIAARPLKTLLFEMELPSVLTFERFAAMATDNAAEAVFESYRAERPVAWKSSGLLDHIHVCSRSRISPAQIEEIILRSELKIGQPVTLVEVDYAQLIQGQGNSRYERASNTAEELRGVAKATNTIIVMASQISRKKGEDGEVSLHDAKDSGSVENSSSLLLGAWQEIDGRDRIMKIKILKNTKGKPGHIVECNWDGEKMKITERGKISQDDLPMKR